MKTIGRGSLSSVLSVIVNIGWVITWIAFIVGLILVVVSPFVDPPEIEVDFKIPVAFTLDQHSHRVSAPNVARAELTDTQGTIHFVPRDTRIVAIGALALLAFGAVSTWILGNLRGVFATLRQGRPFVAANAVRIRRIAWGFIALQIAGSAITYIGSHRAMTDFAAQGLAFHRRLDFDPVAFVGALILFVIAEVFREGSRLDEDQSLTV